MSDNEDDDCLGAVTVDNASHQELPYLIHAKTMVPYLVGRRGHTIIALELKMYGWKVKLVKKNNGNFILATRGKEKWVVQVISTSESLTLALRQIKVKIDKEFELMAEEIKALPVIAVVGEDSAAMLSAQTLMGLSPV